MSTHYPSTTSYGCYACGSQEADTYRCVAGVEYTVCLLHPRCPVCNEGPAVGGQCRHPYLEPSVSQVGFQQSGPPPLIPPLIPPLSPPLFVMPHVLHYPQQTDFVPRPQPSQLTNTLDVTPSNRVGMMGYLGPGDIVRFCHAVHMLVDAGQLTGQFLILIKRRLFTAVSGMMTTVAPAQVDDHGWDVPGVTFAVYQESLGQSCTLKWFVIDGLPFADAEAVAFKRETLVKIYPHLFKSLRHLFDFRCLFHYFDGNMKQWGKEHRPKVLGQPMRPIKIDRDPIMLRAIYRPDRYRPGGGEWFVRQAQVACTLITPYDLRLEKTRQVNIKGTEKAKASDAPYTITQFGSSQLDEPVEMDIQQVLSEQFQVPVQHYSREYDVQQGQIDPQGSILLFIRHHTAEPGRNTQPSQVARLYRVARLLGVNVVLAGFKTAGEYAAFVSGCQLELGGDQLPPSFCCYCFEGDNLLRQMQYYANFLCALGNNASALDLASGSGIPVFRDVEFPAMMKRGQNYEPCHNSYLRRALNLGIAPFKVLEQEVEGPTFLKIPPTRGETHSIRIFDADTSRYVCYKTPDTLEKLLLFFVAAVLLRRPEVSQSHHITLPDGIDLTLIDVNEFYALARNRNGLAVALSRYVEMMWDLVSRHEVNYNYVTEELRTKYRDALDPNLKEKDSEQ